MTAFPSISAPGAGKTSTVPGTIEAAKPDAASKQKGSFFPADCDTLEEAGLPEAYVEALVFKHLLAVGANTGRGVAGELCLPGKPIVEMLTILKNRQLVVYKGQSSMSDFEYTLTEAGRTLANRYLAECSYSGPAPVPFNTYVKSVEAQSIQSEQPGPQQLREAFNDLLINDDMLERLGPAVNSGRGLFLYGYPGNGKTSIAERITGSFGEDVWIPRAIFVDGETIQLYDPQSHEVVGGNKPSIIAGESFDRRWIKIKRPTIVVGGELQMSALELRYDPHTKITEAPLQMKSNCGTLVIDDFGRQRMDPVELLNRWIVPLEKRFDFLTLFNGKKIQVPFDQLIVFSTNLEPKELVDDAFLRRIPYKINVANPSESEFRALMKIMSANLGVDYCEPSVEYLIEKHYKANDRAFRCCHPRDLIQQILNHAKFHGKQGVMTKEAFDAACDNYFTLL